MDAALFVKAFAALFAIMNPFVALPMFLSLTSDMDAATQRRTGLRVALYSTVLGVVILASGSLVLTFFGVSVDDFRIAGGVVLLMIGLGMLNGTGSSAHTGTAAEREQHAQVNDPSFYPMSFPMIVGPGTITSLVLLAGANPSLGGYLSVGAALLVVIAILGVVLWFAADIGHHLSQTLRTIMTRLMGMILAAIAVEMLVAGLGTVFPGLR
ncbi:MAG: MarC family protein [Propionicimonas sp.]|uniref:MarC family protein n=1 Tax=Propionicimonas sp. TaxID=1955623 RepID=UPI003D0D7F46